MHNIILGETCLLSHQLRRLDILNGPKGLFENMLINLDGVQFIIKDDLSQVIARDHLSYEYYTYYPDYGVGDYKWINKKYTLDNDNIFSWPVCCFFHYDKFTIYQIESLKRKIDRLKSNLEDSVNVNFFYYYKGSIKYNIDLFLQKAKNFIEFVSKKYNKVFTMTVITKNYSKDSYILRSSLGSINCIDFLSPHSWDEPNDNWNGSSDDDLFDKFAEYYKTITTK
jgi:hypothetical protein